jgi:hypothetical protein
LAGGKTKNREKDGGVPAKGVAGSEGGGATKIQWVMANFGVALVGEENGRRVAFPRRAGLAVRGTRRQRGGTGEVQWVTKKLATGL